MYKAMLDGVGSSIENNLMAASTFNCRILGFRVLFRVLQYILIVSLQCIVSHPQTGSMEKAAEEKEVQLVEVSVWFRLKHL